MTLCVCVSVSLTEEVIGKGLPLPVWWERVGSVSGLLLLPHLPELVSFIRQAALNAACVREVSGRTKPM